MTNVISLYVWKLRCLFSNDLWIKEELIREIRKYNHGNNKMLYVNICVELKGHIIKM